MAASSLFSTHAPLSGHHRELSARSRERIMRRIEEPELTKRS